MFKIKVKIYILKFRLYVFIIIFLQESYRTIIKIIYFVEKIMLIDKVGKVPHFYTFIKRRKKNLTGGAGIG